MNIDLLFTEAGAGGLVAGENFSRKVAGALFDPAASTIELEFVDAMEPLALNIPIGQELFEPLNAVYFPFVGAVKSGHIAQAYQVPLAIVGDAFHAQMAAHHRPHPMPIRGFAEFMAACTSGQPVHRDDLSDDSTIGCVLGDASPAALEFAPHLAQQRALEAAPRGPQAPGPSAPGMGLGGGGGGTYIPPADNGGGTEGQ